jgi:O-antigen ligase
MTSAIARPSDSSSSFLSIGFAFCIPLVIGAYWAVYWQKQDLATLLLRPVIMALSTLLAIVWYTRPVTIAERNLVTVMVLFCAILLIPSLTASNPFRAVADWVKVSIMCALCIMWTRALRDEATARVFGISLIIGAIILTVLILVVYFKYMGLVMPTYKSTRGLKGITQATIPLNAVPFAAMMSYLSAFSLLRTNKSLLFLGVIVCAISTVFTGSRTPVAIVVAGGGLLFLVVALRSHNLLYRITAIVCILAGLTEGILFFQKVSYKDIIKISEGRTELWRIAWEKFLDKPMVGNGFESWDDDLVSKLPDQYKLASGIAANTAGGGYHNEYMTMLAEQGIVGTIPTLTLFGFFFYTCWKLAFRQSRTWRYGYWALFGCLVILLRACVEVPGLFGYGGQEPSDYLCFLFVAIAVSRLSVEEDYLRATMEQVQPLARVREIPRSGFRSSEKGIAHIS